MKNKLSGIAIESLRDNYRLHQKNDMIIPFWQQKSEKQILNEQIIEK